MTPREEESTKVEPESLPEWPALYRLIERITAEKASRHPGIITEAIVDAVTGRYDIDTRETWHRERRRNHPERIRRLSNTVFRLLEVRRGAASIRKITAGILKAFIVSQREGVATYQERSTRDKYTRLFIDETRNFLESIFSSLLTVRDRGADIAGLADSIRMAHSIRGMAIFEEQGTIASLAYALEQGLARLAGEKEGSVLLDKLLQGVDLLRVMIDEVHSDGCTGQDPDELVEAIEKAAWH